MIPASGDSFARIGGAFGRKLRRMFSSNQELVSEEMVAKVRAAGAKPVADYRVRDMAVVTGTLASITVNPKSGTRWLEAELTDGSGSLLLVWMGRRMIPGLEPGRGISARGRLSLMDGHRVIFNPYYELTE